MIKKGLFALLSILTFLALSCSPEPEEQEKKATQEEVEIDKTASQDSEQTAKEGEVFIEPSSPTKGTTLRARFKGTGRGELSYSWYINGEEHKEIQGRSLRTDTLEKGDVIRVAVKDNTNEYVSDDVTIGNLPPRISRLWLLPGEPNKTSTLKADVDAMDPDGDKVTISYKWYVNEELAYEAENENTFKGQFKKGDRVSVAAVPSDGDEEGSMRTREVEIANSVPVFEDSNIKTDFSGGIYKIFIKASDPDGDPLTYSLKTAPDGMTINKDTGFIQWNVPPDFSGKTSINVSVTDGGGEAAQNFVLEMTPEQGKAGNDTLLNAVCINIEIRNKFSGNGYVSRQPIQNE